MIERKAKSRLKTDSAWKDETKAAAEAVTTHASPAVHQPGHHRRTANHSTTQNLTQKYAQHWPALILGMIGWAATYYLLHNFRPQEIANIPWPLAFGPLHLTLIWAVFFTGSFILLKSRRGFWLALMASSWLLFKTHNVIWTPWLILCWIGLPLLLEIILTSLGLIWSRNHSSSKPRHQV
jgi:hypothetical protein